jgi:hypothetical protein
MRAWLTALVAAALLVCSIPVWASADQRAPSSDARAAASSGTGKTPHKRKHGSAKRHAACLKQHKKHKNHKKATQHKKASHHKKAAQHKNAALQKQDQQVKPHKQHKKHKRHTNAKRHGCAHSKRAQHRRHPIAHRACASHRLPRCRKQPKKPVSPPVSTPPAPPVSAPAGVSVSVGAPGPAVNCSVTLSVGANIQSALSSAAAGTVVCLNAGNYGSVTLSGIAPPGNVTLAPAPGATVTFTDFTLTGAPSSNLTIQGFFIPGGVDDETGTPGGLVFQYNTISHHAQGYGFYFDAGGNGANGTQSGIQILNNQIDHVGECLAITRGTDQERAFTFSGNVCGPGLGYGDTQSTQPGHYIEIGGITGVTVDHNAFVGPADPNAAPVGLHLNVFHIFGDASNVDFSNNILWHTQTIGQALLIQEGQFDNVTINNNLDVEDPACAVANSNCDSYAFWTADVHGFSFQNNTVVNSYWGVLLTESQTSDDYNGGTGYTVAHNIAVQTADGPDISYGECVSSCLFDYNVTDDQSARKAGSTHNVVGWKPSWTSTSWTPTVPYARPPAGYYQPTGLPFAAGYGGSAGP